MRCLTVCYGIEVFSGNHLSKASQFPGSFMASNTGPQESYSGKKEPSRAHIQDLSKTTLTFSGAHGIARFQEI